jgi:hypothetical protein
VTEPADDRPQTEAHAPAAAAPAFEVGGTVRTGFALWRGALGPLMWLALVGLGASLPLSALMALTGFDPLSPASYTPLALVGVALALILGLPFSIGSAAGSLVVLNELVRAGEVSYGTFAAFAAGYRAFWRVLGAWLAMGAASAALAVPAAVSWLAAGTPLPPPPLTVALAAAAALPALFLWVRWAPATAVVVLEGRRPIAAIARAAALTRGRFLRVLGVLAAFAAISLAAQTLAALLGGSGEVAQILAMAIQVGFLGPLSAALGYALYLGLTRSEQTDA